MPESPADRADFWRYITDWSYVDFDRYYPLTGMQYPEYARKRAAGEIPAPDRATLIRNETNNPRLGE